MISAGIVVLFGWAIVWWWKNGGAMDGGGTGGGHAPVRKAVAGNAKIKVKGKRIAVK